MINGVNITLVYHIYAKNLACVNFENTPNIYSEINRRCLIHFKDVFDQSIVCISVDNVNNKELIEQAFRWVLSIGLKNLCVKIVENTAYGDAKTFYDEVAYNLDKFNGLVFFAHCKGITHTGNEQNLESLKEWIAFSYYCCLDNIKSHVNNLLNNYVAMTYVLLFPREEKLTKYGYIPTGTFFLFNPRKLLNYAESHGEKIPEMVDRYSAEFFLPNIVNKDTLANNEIGFEGNAQVFSISNCKDVDPLFINHKELISYFLTESRVREYCEFYEKITNGLL